MGINQLPLDAQDHHSKSNYEAVVLPGEPGRIFHLRLLRPPIKGKQDTLAVPQCQYN